MTNTSVAPVGSQVTDEEIYFNAVFLSIVSMVTIIGNVIALHAFFVTPDLRKPTYYFIACLCISDLMVATFSMPCWITDMVLNWKEDFPVILRRIYQGFDILCGTWSIMNLAMISIERYICITYALHYFRIMTLRRVYSIFVFVLLYSIVVMLVDRLGPASHTDSNYKVKQFFIVFAAFLVPVLIKIFSYSRIYVEAQKHTKQINELKRFSVQANDSINTDDGESDSSGSVGKGRHSDSVASWTISPLARKRQCTQNRILVLSDEVNSSSEREHVKHKEKICSMSTEKEQRKTSHRYYKLLCHKSSERYRRKQPSIVLTDANDSNENTDIESLLDEQKQTVVRQHSNGSVKTTTCRPISEMEQISEESDSSPEHDSKTKSIHANSDGDNTHIYCQVEKRKRRFPCSTKHEQSSSSAEKKRQEDIREVTSTKRLSKPLTTFAKWSPSNSPVLFKKSFRKNNNNSNHSNNNNNGQSRHLQRIRRFKKELRAAKIVALIMGTFFFCWSPFMVLIVLSAVGVQVSMRIIMIAVNLHYLNSAINPILYVVLNKVYRQAIVRAIQNVKRHFNISSSF